MTRSPWLILGALASAAACLAAIAPSGSAGPERSTLRPARGITVPAGFRAELYATGLRKPTALAFGPGGLLYATLEGGFVVAVGRGSSRPLVVARGFRVPLGLAWVGRTLFVSDQGTLYRLRLQGPLLAGRRVLVTGLPFRLHQQDNVVVGPDGRLYLGSGSTCDACRERSPLSGTVLSVRPDGRDLRVYARGLRNPYGLAFEPGTGRLFVSVNNQDKLGRREPAETIVVARRGGRYGWPTCWPSWRTRRLVGSCAGVQRPFAYLEPHSAPGGMAFYTGATFPRAYRGRLFVAEWGQYLSGRWGRKVVQVDPRNGRVRPFADGFDHPLAVAVEPGGGLLVADWGRGVVYRIQAR